MDEEDVGMSLVLKVGRGRLTSVTLVRDTPGGPFHLNIRKIGRSMDKSGLIASLGSRPIEM